jgi:hypothetical protein
MDVTDLRPFILDVPDFPKPGVVFKDFTPLWPIRGRWRWRLS